MSPYEKFYQLHHQSKPVVIANAWNVKSAQLIEKSGFDAIATSSGAISSSMGYEDGEKMPFSEILYIIKRIKSATTLSLSVDLEKGYTGNEAELTKIIQSLIDIGVVGINLEDSQGEDIYLQKLKAIKSFLTETGQNLFINARTDGFLLKIPSPLETTLRRAALYKAAGADGLFVTGVADASIIKEITASTTLPVNVVGNPKLSSIDTIASYGVKRISMAVGLYNATYKHLEAMATEIITKQSLAPMF